MALVKDIVRGVVKPIVTDIFGDVETFPPILLDGNTVAWYDSQLLSTITKDGSDFVSRWNDRLGSGHDLIQALGTNQPKWIDVDGVLFDAVDNYMKTVAFTFVQPEMIYIVCKQITWTVNNTITDGDIGQTGRILQRLVTPSLSATAGTYSTDNNNLSLNTFGIIRVLFDGASSKIQINETTPIAENLGTANMGGFTLGKYGTGDVAFAHMQVKEIILRKVADGAVDEQNIYNYLANKYEI